MRKLTIVLWFMILVVTACGGDDDTGDPARSRDVTIMPLPNQTLVEGCPSLDLENWVETAYFNMQSFLTEAEISSQTANNNNRNETIASLDRLVLLRNSVSSTDTPSCVTNWHQLILSDMQRVIDDYQQFANAQIDADELKQKAGDDLEQIRSNLNSMLEDVAPLYQVDPQTP